MRSRGSSPSIAASRTKLFKPIKDPPHLALHPFGRIPAYEEGDLALFETGAIVFHNAEHHAGLLPKDANARARAITWMFAAHNTVEPPILELANARLLEGDKPWGIVDEFPNLAVYVARGESRLAYKRAFAAQLAINAAKP